MPWHQINGLTAGERLQAYTPAGLWVVVTTIAPDSASTSRIGGRGSGRPAIATLAKLTILEPDMLDGAAGMLQGLARCVLIATQRTGNRMTALVRPLDFSKQAADAPRLKNDLQTVTENWPQLLTIGLNDDGLRFTRANQIIDQVERLCNLAQGFIRSSTVSKLAHLNTIDLAVRLRMTQQDLLEDMESSKVARAQFLSPDIHRRRDGRGQHLRLVTNTTGQ